MVVARVEDEGVTAMRETFIDTATALLDDDPRTALVLADISADASRRPPDRHPDRVINVGIREQLMLGVAGGLALTGLRPIVHSYAPFLVDRAYEQIKLDLDHQDVGRGAGQRRRVVRRRDGRPHPPCRRATSRCSTRSPGWTVHVPGHADEVAPLLRAAAATDDPVYLRLSTGQQRGAATGRAAG